MSNGYFYFPEPQNEPVYAYAPGSQERQLLKQQLVHHKAEELDIPMYINGQEVRTGQRIAIHPPHELRHTLGYYHKGDASHVQAAIDAALKAKAAWASMPWEHRASIFLKAADLITDKYRYAMNATTMLGQSKNVFQAEIDAVCELADFLRFNVHYLSEIYAQQPISPHGVYNRMEYRPLEGFVVAITPFNFSSIAGNLPTVAAMCGNVVVWKPAENQIYAAQQFMRILIEAGLPAGVINLVFAPGATVGEICFNHPDFAGVHFTGSTTVFQDMWNKIGQHIARYKSYPRIVGETGGKDFVIAHASADIDAVVANLVRGAFEYQGQKCSAASRAYLPSNLADKIVDKLIHEVKTIRMGTVEDFRNFMNAVIDEKAFDKITGYIEQARKSPQAQILVGGNASKEEGYFIEPTVIEAKDPHFVTMEEEIFGPVLSVYVYDEKHYEETLDLVDRTSPYALTGSVFATDRKAILLAEQKLVNSAGNFYINDKPTGAVVGQQPFGGARASGTNDKAGSILNLYRWLSVRTIKETFVPVLDYRYPFMKES
ncbi:L-glutamate gamma-semialdehyde dehydrogenase [Thermoflavifilum thermophilum]|uniref:L-glutamate gamma-semialdehyde dehydrogenase n=1 Tax=Thermoflavifilum thermophilum TaxID=1393122 RepID=A0A1I7NGJ6_9BACT|nr:L-glutamate gamma-semialdehyde dehydrogenase [Thermoflavifilum thermophilum]SFV33797.1 delta-1-pyrroline-5-carboxylate dehydrogenase [Thermoflavifilum thermophilum]